MLAKQQLSFDMAEMTKWSLTSYFIFDVCVLVILRII